MPSSGTKKCVLCMKTTRSFHVITVYQGSISI